MPGRITAEVVPTSANGWSNSPDPEIDPIDGSENEQHADQAPTLASAQLQLRLPSRQRDRGPDQKTGQEDRDQRLEHERISKSKHGEFDEGPRSATGGTGMTGQPVKGTESGWPDSKPHQERCAREKGCPDDTPPDPPRGAGLETESQSPLSRPKSANPKSIAIPIAPPQQIKAGRITAPMACAVPVRCTT